MSNHFYEDITNKTSLAGDCKNNKDGGNIATKQAGKVGGENYGQEATMWLWEDKFRFKILCCERLDVCCDAHWLSDVLMQRWLDRGNRRFHIGVEGGTFILKHRSSRQGPQLKERFSTDINSDGIDCFLHSPCVMCLWWFKLLAEYVLNTVCTSMLVAGEMFFE